MSLPKWPDIYRYVRVIRIPEGETGTAQPDSGDYRGIADFQFARYEAAMARLKAAVEALRNVRPDSDDARYYQFRKYMQHIDGCTGGGDHFCKCGMASVAMNVEDCISESRFEIDAVLASIDLPEEK